MEKVLEHFQSEAPEYDETIIRLIPFYRQMVDALISIIPFDKNDKINVIDLGCGTGSISHQIAKKYPLSSITCLDVSENMIREARAKLAYHASTSFIIADFNDVVFDRSYDVIVSSLAIHHLSDIDKIKLFQKIYNHLTPGGIFYNADIVLSNNNWNQAVNIAHWIEYMKRSVSEEEVLNKWMPTYYNEDKPAKLTDQLNWLKNIGFKDIDVLWKYFNFAVYGGSK